MKLLFAGMLLFLAGCSQPGGSLAPVVPNSASPAPTSAVAASPAPASAAPSAAASAAPSAAASTAPSNATAVIVKDFKIEPADIKAQGKTVSLAVTNQGPTIHNVTIRDASGTVIVATRDLKPGESETISATLAPRTYVLFCSLPGHESLGTKGTLEVSP